MARTYDRSLVDTIASKAHVINDNGLAVELRPLPDDDRPHALDPRVLAATLPKLASPGVGTATGRLKTLQTISLHSFERAPPPMRKIRLTGRSISSSVR